MAAFHGHRVKDRSAKVERRRREMPVNGRSALLLQSIIQAKAEEARRDVEARAAQAASRKKGR